MAKSTPGRRPLPGKTTNTGRGAGPYSSSTGAPNSNDRMKARQQRPQQGNRQRENRQQQRVDRQQGRMQERQGAHQAVWERHRSHNWQSDHRTWQQRGGYNGYRIPNNRYRGYFGPEHAFRIHGRPFMVYRGYPRFRYGGYWITAVDPWPEYWTNDWYDTDDVYVVYVDNGYYMYNRRYPDVGISIRISI